MVTVHRGGLTMTIPRVLAHHVPNIPIGHLDEEGRDKLDEMLKSGYSVEEIIEFFKTYVPVKERVWKKFRELSRGRYMTDEEKLRMMRGLIENNNLSLAEVLELMKGQLGEEEQARLEEMLGGGLSVQEALDQLAEGLTKKTDLAQKMQQLMEGKDLSEKEVLELLKGQLGKQALSKMQDMLKNGMTEQEVIDYFMRNGEGAG